MKNITIRTDAEVTGMLSEINVRQTTAAQTALEVFTWLRKATLHELKGKFTREEIIALIDSFNGLMPTWRIMCNTQVLVAHTEDAEKYQQSLSMHGATTDLIYKLAILTSAQATILQLELWAFWNRDDENASPNIEEFIARFI
jgi:citrate lyase beta subunit